MFQTKKPSVFLTASVLLASSLSCTPRRDTDAGQRAVAIGGEAEQAALAAGDVVEMPVVFQRTLQNAVLKVRQVCLYEYRVSLKKNADDTFEFQKSDEYVFVRLNERGIGYNNLAWHYLRVLVEEKDKFINQDGKWKKLLSHVGAVALAIFEERTLEEERKADLTNPMDLLQIGSEAAQNPEEFLKATGESLENEFLKRWKLAKQQMVDLVSLSAAIRGQEFDEGNISAIRLPYAYSAFKRAIELAGQATDRDAESGTAPQLVVCSNLDGRGVPIESDMRNDDRVETPR